MQEFTKSELKIAEIGGIVAIVTALIFAVYTTLNPPEVPDPNIQSLAPMAWGLLLGSLAWTGLASARMRTSFFSLDRSIDPTICGVSIVVILAVVVLLHILIIPKMPNTPFSKLPQEVDVREAILLQERNLKLLVSAVILVAGLLVGSYPIRRLMKK